MEKFETAFDLLEELDKVKDKITFMGEVTAALAERTDTAGISDAALNGLWLIYSEIETKCANIHEALSKDFIITKKLPEMPAGKANESKLDNFCAAVEKEISRPCKKCEALN
jgi:hypothetical protein